MYRYFLIISAILVFILFSSCSESGDKEPVEGRLCDGISYVSRCHEGGVLYCDSGKTKFVSCGTQSCVLDQRGKPVCADRCTSATAPVCVDASTLSVCENEVVVKRLCDHGCVAGECRQSATSCEQEGSYCASLKLAVTCEAGVERREECTFSCKDGRCLSKIEKQCDDSGGVFCDGSDLVRCGESIDREKCPFGCSEGACLPQRCTEATHTCRKGTGSYEGYLVIDTLCIPDGDDFKLVTMAEDEQNQTHCEAGIFYHCFASTQVDLAAGQLPCDGTDKLGGATCTADQRRCLSPACEDPNTMPLPTCIDDGKMEGCMTIITPHAYVIEKEHPCNTAMGYKCMKVSDLAGAKCEKPCKSGGVEFGKGGKCDGDILTYCNNGEASSINCATNNLVCGEGLSGFDCKRKCDDVGELMSSGCIFDRDTSRFLTMQCVEDNGKQYYSERLQPICSDDNSLAVCKGFSLASISCEANSCQNGACQHAACGEIPESGRCNAEKTGIEYCHKMGDEEAPAVMACGEGELCEELGKPTCLDACKAEEVGEKLECDDDGKLWMCQMREGKSVMTPVGADRLCEDGKFKTCVYQGNNYYLPETLECSGEVGSCTDNRTCTLKTVECGATLPNEGVCVDDMTLRMCFDYEGYKGLAPIKCETKCQAIDGNPRCVQKCPASKIGEMFTCSRKKATVLACVEKPTPQSTSPGLVPMNGHASVCRAEGDLNITHYCYEDSAGGRTFFSHAAVACDPEGQCNAEGTGCANPACSSTTPPATSAGVCSADKQYLYRCFSGLPVDGVYKGKCETGRECQIVSTPQQQARCVPICNAENVGYVRGCSPDAKIEVCQQVGSGYDFVKLNTDVYCSEWDGKFSFCKHGKHYRKSCTDFSGTCSADHTKCELPECADEDTEEGRCDGTTVVYCEKGQSGLPPGLHGQIRLDCATVGGKYGGKYCGYSEADKYYWCQAEP